MILLLLSTAGGLDVRSPAGYVATENLYTHPRPSPPVALFNCGQ